MYIQLNGQILYYEKHGLGKPFLLVHGNNESHEIFDVLISKLKQEYTVYAIDTRGHGKSSMPNAFHYQDMAQDMAAFVKALRLDKPLYYGFSDGGIIGLLLASYYPDLLSAMIISGANLTPEGCTLSTRVKDYFTYKKTKDPLLKLMLEEPHITLDDLNKITIPTLVLAGAKDLIKLKETKKIAGGIPSSTLQILPKETHFSYVTKSPKLYPLIKAYLDSLSTISPLR